MSSSASEVSSLSGYTRKMAFPKSHIQINIDNHFNSKVYTAGSLISGNATIITQRDVHFESIQILLMGTTKTRVDGFSSPSESTHIFLKLAMPVPESTYPVPRILEAGHLFTVPFNFVIPPYLTIGACNHHITSDLVHDQHIRLPPTMGFWERDDMTPEMAKVEYSIKARVFREPEFGQRLIKVMEASHQIRVLPVAPEDPPLSITKHDREYSMTKSKTLRKKLLSGKLGKITATASQPEAALLRPDGLGISSTTAQVHLNFEPASPELSPPKVTAVSGKLTAHTFYASGPISSFPNLGDWNRAIAVEKRGSYSTSVSLFSQSVEKFKWSRHASQDRRDSGYSSDTPETHSESEENRARRRHSKHMKTRSGSSVIHSAILQIPIKLPLHKKTFIPTFHSCIASRVYTLQLALSVSSGTTSSTINLSVPLQVAVDMDDQQGMGLPSFETAVEEAAADEYLRPRMLSFPDVHYQQTSTLPGYGEIDGRRQIISAM